MDFRWIYHEQIVLILTHICDLRIKTAHFSNKASYDSIPWRCGTNFLHSVGDMEPVNDCQSIDFCSASMKTWPTFFFGLVVGFGLVFHNCQL